MNINELGVTACVIAVVCCSQRAHWSRMAYSMVITDDSAGRAQADWVVLTPTHRNTHSNAQTHMLPRFVVVVVLVVVRRPCWVQLRVTAWTQRLPRTLLLDMTTPAFLLHCSCTAGWLVLPRPAVLFSCLGPNMQRHAV